MSPERATQSQSNGWIAPSGLSSSHAREPRALPWAGIGSGRWPSGIRAPAPPPTTPRRCPCTWDTEENSRPISQHGLIASQGPTARPMTAQGNALGRQWMIDGALKGRPNRHRTVRPPLQGWPGFPFKDPGRCPGLGLGRAVGPLAFVLRHLPQPLHATVLVPGIPGKTHGFPCVVIRRLGGFARLLASAVTVGSINANSRRISAVRSASVGRWNW